MKMGKVFCLVISLAVALPGPLVDRARSQEEQIPPQTAEQKEEGNSLLASMLTAANIPARGMLCGFTGLMAFFTMLISAGTRYAEAAQMMEENCSGPWVITPEMIEEGRVKKKEATGVVSSGDKQP